MGLKICARRRVRFDVVHDIQWGMILLLYRNHNYLDLCDYRDRTVGRNHASLRFVGSQRFALSVEILHHSDLCDHRHRTVCRNYASLRFVGSQWNSHHL